MSKHLPSPVKFREDINGLRAWAVIAVLLFHFSLFGLPGGFVGVDIFFVISGYLMTAIIIGGYQKGKFSVWRFYLSRIRRILPALIALIVVLLIFGWFYLAFYDYRSLAEQSVYAISFIANIFFWKTSGYFDAAAEEKWLLHTWSLAVEAQFYILYPIFLSVIWRVRKSIYLVTIFVGIVFISSMVLSIVLSNWKPTAAFYLLPTRGWELTAGALVYLLSKQFFLPSVIKGYLYWIGWSMLVVSFFVIDESLPWPGIWALLPVLGTSFIIFAYNERCKFTSNFVAQWIGDRSYSLYLWHWPLVVWLYFLGLIDSWPYVILFFIFSFFLAHLSYVFIETPTRKYLTKKKINFEVLIIFTLLLSILSVAFVLKEFKVLDRPIDNTPQAQYMKQFSTDGIRAQQRYENYLIKCNFFSELRSIKRSSIDSTCVSSKQGGVFLWGDSHAQALSYGLRNFLTENYPNTSFSQVATSGCRPHLAGDSITSGDRKFYCDKSNEFVKKAIKIAKPRVVVLAQRDKHQKNHYVELSNYLLSEGVKEVIILGPVPQWDIALPRIISQFYWNSSLTKVNHSSFEYDLFDIDSLMFEKFNHTEHVHYISVLDTLCNSQGCDAILDDKKTPIAFDYGHLTKEGSVYVVETVLAKPLKSMLKK